MLPTSSGVLAQAGTPASATPTTTPSATSTVPVRATVDHHRARAAPTRHRHHPGSAGRAATAGDDGDADHGLPDARRARRRRRRPTRRRDRRAPSDRHAGAAHADRLADVRRPAPPRSQPATHPAEHRGIARGGRHRPPHRDPLHRLRRASRHRARPRDVPGLGPGRIARTRGGDAAGEQRGRAGCRAGRSPTTTAPSSRISESADDIVADPYLIKNAVSASAELSSLARHAAAHRAEAADQAAHRVRLPRASASGVAGERDLEPAHPRHHPDSADPPRVSARGRGRAGGRLGPPRRRRRQAGSSTGTTARWRARTGCAGSSATRSASRSRSTTCARPCPARPSR